MHLFQELWKHGKLAAKRHPMYEKNKFAQFFIYLGIAFWVGYLMFFAVMFGILLQGEAIEPYHIINKGLLFFLMIDIMLRIPFQKTPTQEMKPYLLLPIKRQKLIDMILVRSGLDLFNLFWFCFFAPFAILTVARFYGITGVMSYLLGIWLLMIVNNYWFLLCRTLTKERITWIALPLLIYGALIAAIIIPEHSPVFHVFMLVGEGFITGNLLYFLLMFLLIAGLWYINRSVLKHTVYNELNKIEDTTVQVKSVSEYRFLDRYGELGEYLRLEIKMLLRNKLCRNQLYLVLVVTAMFSGILGFTNTYTGLSKDFFTIYNFILIGIMFLGPLMSYEGNYIDGLMSRKESIYTLLRAKYILYSLAQIIPLLSLLPGMINGNISWQFCLAWFFFVPGPIYFLLFQMTVYNCKTIPLNGKLVSGQSSGSMIQNLVSGASFFVPFAIYGLFTLIFGETYATWALMVVGLAFIIASPYWLKNVYQRFMKRRYQNVDGFHNSRTKI